MKPVLYLCRSCTSCRNATAILDEHGVDYLPREFFREPFTREELEGVLRKAGMRPSELVSTRSTVYRNAGMDEQDVSGDAWLERMLAEPRLIRRPILVVDDEVQVGFNRARLEATAKRLAGRD